MAAPSSVRPTRLKTHPLRERRGEPVDPYELYRRLEIQECREKERAARLKRRQHPVGQYYHTPQVAALDFQRTATPEIHSKKATHIPSRPAIGQYQNSREIRPGVAGAVPTAQQSSSLTITKPEKISAANRSQFQLTRELEDDARIDRQRDSGKRPQKDFDIIFDPISSSRPHKKNRQPNNTGDFRRYMLESSPLVPANNQRQPFDRHNWTQWDERPDLLPDTLISKERSHSIEKEPAQSVDDGRNRDGQGVNIAAPPLDNPVHDDYKKIGFPWPFFCLGR
ncbi:MAG: hypothetical protein M1839_008952 [Geoglossum umbratile]|nr:MAG: hypothetical protein M1839_008952 [Geoglossum umbratile]